MAERRFDGGSEGRPAPRAEPNPRPLEASVRRGHGKRAHATQGRWLAFSSAWIVAQKIGVGIGPCLLKLTTPQPSFLTIHHVAQTTALCWSHHAAINISWMEGNLTRLTSIEFCAGAGGQALGLELAGFEHKLLVDNDADCCATLSANRPDWRVEQRDMAQYDLPNIGAVDLFAAGLPCPPFSVAGKQLGENDERNLFPAALELIHASQPKFVLIENVRGFLSRSFETYRGQLRDAFSEIGYEVGWKLFDAKDFGVSQSRSRVAIVAAKSRYWSEYSFPEPCNSAPLAIGDLLVDLMAENGWHGARKWQRNARAIAPTIVGGSKKHGGPDLGPTRARSAWEKLGVNGKSIAETAPPASFDDMPRLTNRMVARVQGFPDNWRFMGKKTSAYRQVGNAFPPPVACALGKSIRDCILAVDDPRASAVAAE